MAIKVVVLRTTVRAEKLMREFGAAKDERVARSVAGCRRCESVGCCVGSCWGSSDGRHVGGIGASGRRCVAVGVEYFDPYRIDMLVSEEVLERIEEEEVGQRSEIIDTIHAIIVEMTEEDAWRVVWSEDSDARVVSCRRTNESRPERASRRREVV
jgi:hypothetical protein